MIIDGIAIHAKAKKLLNDHQTRDMHRLCRQLGIRIYYRDFQNLLGMYSIIQRRRCVFLKNGLSDQQERIVLAHELGHDQLHRQLVKELGFIQDHTLFNTNDQAELEANLFAANLLIADHELSELYGYGYTDEQIASQLQVPLSFLLLREKYPVKPNHPLSRRPLPRTSQMLN